MRHTLCSMQGEACVTFALHLDKLPFPNLSALQTQYLCAHLKGCHVECLHIDLESFSLGKRISNFTMQEGNRYQLQTALKMFKKYTIYTGTHGFRSLLKDTQ